MLRIPKNTKKLYCVYNLFVIIHLNIIVSTDESVDTMDLTRLRRRRRARHRRSV